MPVKTSSRNTLRYKDSKNIHLLYVEDDAGLAPLLQKQLQRQYGCGVSVAYDAEEGLRELQNTSCDLAIVDYNLPVLNGLQLLAIQMKAISVRGNARQGAG